MATIVSERVKEQRGSFTKRFNWNFWLQDNITGSRAQTIWIVVLGIITFGILAQQLLSSNLGASSRATIIFAVWLLLVGSTIVGELFNLHIGLTRWLKENLIGSVSNALVTLLMALCVGLTVAGLWDWGVTRATFSPDMTHPDVRTTGASWGVIWAARKLWLTGLLGPEHNWRVWLATGFVAVLSVLSFVSSRESLKEKLRPVARFSNFLWLLAPFAIYMVLAGSEYVAPLINPSTLITGVAVALALMAFLWFFKVIKLTTPTILGWVLAWPIAYLVWRLVARTEIFTPINVDDWGGLLLTVIFAIFVNILSVPIGVLLALGRRADVQGIPSWIVWPVAILSTIYFLATSTPELWATSRNGIEQTLALWPLVIIVAAYYFLKKFDGNLVQAFSVLFIELIRGVPLITLLFMAIVMAPFFTEGGTSVKSFWAVIVGYTIFSSAYAAELVRGGLQAIPRGQYEAADSIGLNVLQKYRFIVLPQALRILIPPLAGSVIGTFKSSSLVALVGMIDLVGSTRAIIANEDWLGLRTELYVGMFVLYFAVSSVVSWYSRRLEERTGLGVR